MPYNAANTVAFAQRQTGRYEGGECWTLVENAVTRNGGKSSRVLTPRFSGSADYIWGTAVSASAVIAGDVLQFRNFTWITETTTRITQTNGDYTTNTQRQTQTCPHHTAMLVRSLGDGVVEVVEQNIPARTGTVQTVQMRIRSAPAVTTSETDPFTNAVTETTVTHTITNPPTCYRPQNA